MLTLIKLDIKLKITLNRCKMRILITGSSGMVGRNLIEYAFERQLPYKLLTPSSRQLNLLDYTLVERYLAESRPDMIVHAAGVVGGIQANIRNPVKFLVSNTDMARNLIVAAKVTGIKSLLNIGSSCMYPRGAPNPLKEECILKGELEPTNEGYALAKIFAAKLCEYISSSNSEYAFKTIIPCNLYGRWDNFDENSSHMIPAVIRKLHEAKTAGASFIDIWGDGSARREFMYAGDLADFIFECIKQFDKLPSLMNVGLGSDFSINDYYRVVAKVVGYSCDFQNDLSKPVGMTQKLVDINKLSDFGWSHSTQLENGIQKTYEFYKKEILHD